MRAHHWTMGVIVVLGLLLGEASADEQLPALDPVLADHYAAVVVAANAPRVPLLEASALTKRADELDAAFERAHRLRSVATRLLAESGAGRLLPGVARFDSEFLTEAVQRQFAEHRFAAQVAINTGKLDAAMQSLELAQGLLRDALPLFESMRRSGVVAKVLSAAIPDTPFTFEILDGGFNIAPQEVHGPTDASFQRDKRGRDLAEVIREQYMREPQLAMVQKLTTEMQTARAANDLDAGGAAFARLQRLIYDESSAMFVVMVAWVYLIQAEQAEDSLERAIVANAVTTPFVTDRVVRKALIEQATAAGRMGVAGAHALALEARYTEAAQTIVRALISRWRPYFDERPSTAACATASTKANQDLRPMPTTIDGRLVATARLDVAKSAPTDSYYPESSRRKGEIGYVGLATLVRRDGCPLMVQVRVSSGFPELDQAAVNWASNAVYALSNPLEDGVVAFSLRFKLYPNP